METTIEFEPFMKTGFKLLRCTKDISSIQKMFKHFEDAIQEQYGETAWPTNAAKKIDVPTILLLKELDIKQTDDVITDNKSSSSNLLSNLLPTMSKSTVEICSSSSSSSPTNSLNPVQSDTVIVIDSDSEMETDDIESMTCCVCKDSAKVENSLVECLECHLIYHKDCHVPSISDINLNDPRIVWYCYNCRSKDSQKAYLQSSKKESKKSSSKSTPIAKPKISSISKTSQNKANSNKSKSASTIRSSKSTQQPLSNCLPITSVMKKKIKVMKKKAAKNPKKK